jgi:hypothetical protein
MTTDGQFVSQSSCQAPSGSKDQIFVIVSCGFVNVGRPLWRKDGSVIVVHVLRLESGSLWIHDVRVLYITLPITVAARSKAWTVFALSNTEVMGSNPTRGMDVYVSLFCVCVVCVGSGLATRWSPVQGVLWTVYRIKKLKKRPRSKGL